MKTRFLSALTGLGWPLVTVLSTLAANPAPSLDPLQGTWTTSKTSREGQAYSQVIEIKNSQLTLQILDANNQIRMFAQGTVKAAKAGPFDILVISNIRGGRSPDEMESVEDDRTVVYTLRDGQWFIATGLDKERENEKPSMDVYARKEAAAAPAGSPPAAQAKWVGHWKMEVTLGDDTRDYELRIEWSNGQLAGTLVSPRSGPHPCKSVRSKESELVVEVERDVSGNQVTFVYQGTLTAQGLSGKVTVKGYEDRGSGTWKASK